MSHLLFNAVASCILYPALCCVFELADTGALKRPSFGMVKNITGLQSSGPVFAGHLSLTSVPVTAATVAPRLQTVRHNDDWLIILLNKLPSLCITNLIKENEASVMKRGPSRHTASLSYNLSYLADKAKKQG